MSFGWGVGDIAAISSLAAKVYTAYRDAPNGYKHISRKVNSLHIMIHKAAEHFESTTLSGNDRQEGQKVLKGCENILGDLNSLIWKYNSLASNNTSQDFQRVKLSTTKDIVSLSARLTANATLLSRFIQRFDIFTITTICILC